MRRYLLMVTIVVAGLVALGGPAHPLLAVTRAAVTPPPLTRVVTAPSQIIAGNVASATASCPSGMSVGGGGFNAGSGSVAPWSIFANHPTFDNGNGGPPTGAGWFVEGQATGAATPTFTAYAICIPTMAGLEYIQNPQTIYSGQLDVTAPCSSPDKQAIGGGYTLYRNVQLVRSNPDPGNSFKTWRITVKLPTFSDPNGATAYAVCAPRSETPGLGYQQSAFDVSLGTSQSGTSPACAAGTSLLGGGFGTSNAGVSIESLAPARDNTAWSAGVANNAQYSSTSKAHIDIFAMCAGIQPWDTTCTQQSIQHDLDYGGVTLLDCPTPIISFGAPVTMVTGTATLQPLPGKVVIFDGGGATPLLKKTGGSLTLSGLTLRHARSLGPDAPIANAGALTVISSTLLDNTSYTPGVLTNAAAGVLTVISSTLTDNQSYGGNTGILTNNAGGAATVISSTLDHNTTVGGAIANSGALTVTTGALTDNGASGGGSGALLNTVSGVATVISSTLSGNSGSQGGAINNGGALTVTTSALAHNSTATIGGAIANTYTGALTVISSTVADNTANNDGGAIDNVGRADMRASTLARNGVSSDGGGGGGAIRNDRGATLTVTNSTLTGNHAPAANGMGGAILDQGGALTVTNSTLAGNSAAPRFGGAIFGGATLSNTLIANNTCFDGSHSITDGGYNLEYQGGGPATCGFQDHAQSGDPRLGSLADNGGPTQTLAVSTLGYAYAHGNPAVCQQTGPGQVNGVDQRGLPRPSQYCAIGAFEPQAGLEGGGGPPADTATATGTTTAPATATPTATGTAAPATATTTAVPPTATATDTAVPTTATSTAVPPTATSTMAPPTMTSTSTPVPATATGTVVPPTSTSTVVPPTATSTSTVAPPTATSTPTAMPVCQLFVLPAFDTVPRGGHQAVLVDAAPNSALTLIVRAKYPAGATLYTDSSLGASDGFGATLTGKSVAGGYRYTFPVAASGLALLTFAIPPNARPGTVSMQVTAQEPCGLFKTITTFQVRGIVRGAASARGDAVTLAIALPRGGTAPANAGALARRGLLRVTTQGRGATARRVLRITYHPHM